MSDVLLTANGLTKVFGHGRAAVRAVDAVDLGVACGEVVLIMGPSGSGKTTLLSMMGGLLRPSSGCVQLDGIELTTLGPRALTRLRRRSIGFVFQTFNLLESLNARENVEIALNIAGSRGAEARERATRLLTEAGLGGRLDFRVGELSGGERQRVAIARALANEPLLLLADEPTANLDSEHGLEVMALLRERARGDGRSAIVVSHDDRVRPFADRVLNLVDGRLADERSATLRADVAPEQSSDVADREQADDLVAVEHEGAFERTLGHLGHSV